MDVRFIGVIGDPGSGKTNYITDVLYRQSLHGDPIVANYQLEFPSIYMEFSKIATLPPQLLNAYIGLDELGEGADSYDWFEEQSKQLGKLIRQLRKRNCRVLYSVQGFHLIVPRLRRATNGFIIMEDMDRHILHGDPKLPESKTNYHCKGKFKMQILDANMRLLRKGVFDGRPTRHLYNTQEIISK